MANLYISEFNKQGFSADGKLASVAILPPVDSQVLTFTTTTQSSALSARFIRVISDSDCHIAAGENPTATTSSMKIVAGSAEYFGVIAGHKIAAVIAS